MATPTPTPQQNLNDLPPDVAAALARARTLARQNLDLTLAHLPAEMKSLKHWVLWRFEVREGKLTKVPYVAQLDKPRRAASNQAETWHTAELAVTVLKADWARKNGGFYDGLGFCFLNSHYSGMDLDDVVRDGCVIGFVTLILVEFRPCDLDLRSIVLSEIKVGCRLL